MTKKKMTIENLAESMQKGFAESDKKIENLAQLMEKRFKGVDKRFESVEKKIEDEVGGLAAMTKREFDKVYGGIELNQKQIESLRKEHLAHDFKMTEMVHKADYFKLEERIIILEKKVLSNH